MSQIRVEIDLDDVIDSALSNIGLLTAPQYERDTNSGKHVVYVIDEMPDWLDSTALEDNPDYKYRRRELFSLVRDVIASKAVGYDRAAPLDRPLSAIHGEYRRYAGSQHESISITRLLSLVDGIPTDSDTPLDENEIKALARFGYEPGGEYKRDKCPHGDHISGGQGKGECVKVSPDGKYIYCYGEHESGDSPKMISAARLIARYSGNEVSENEDFLDAVLLWASRVDKFDDAIAGTLSVWRELEPSVNITTVRRRVAAARLRFLLRDHTPRPKSHKIPLPIYWDASAYEVAQYISSAHALDASIDVKTRQGHFERAFPALWYEDKKVDPQTQLATYEWKLDGAALEGIRCNDQYRLLQAGIIPAACCAVGILFEKTTGWYAKNGLPVKMLLPPVYSNATGISKEKAAKRLLSMLDLIPVPENIELPHAIALRLAWLLPLFTETFLGQQPLVMIAGGTGAGKGQTIKHIQDLYQWHHSGQLTITEEKDFDNTLMHGRKGSVLGLDELGTNAGSSAVKPSTMARLKSIMTMPYHSVRKYHTQEFVSLRMAHAFYGTGRSFDGLAGQLENDWNRRVVPIQFPQQPATQDYIASLQFASDMLDPVEMFKLIAVLVEGLDLTKKRKEWKNLWPNGMPAWQAVVGIAHEFLGLTLDYADFKDLLQVDESAVECFRSYWAQVDDPISYTKGKHRLALVKEWASNSFTWRHYAQGNHLRAALVAQASAPDGNVKFTVGRKGSARHGTITIYVKNSYAWRFSPAKDDEQDENAELPVTEPTGPSNSDFKTIARAIIDSASGGFLGSRSYTENVDENSGSLTDSSEGFSAITECKEDVREIDSGDGMADTAIEIETDNTTDRKVEVDWPEPLDNAIAVDFESYHPDKNILHNKGAWFYWEDGRASTTCLAGITGIFDPEQKGCIVVIWTPEELPRPITLTKEAIRLLNAAGGYTVEYFTGPECPKPLADAIEAGYPAIAHNSQFDARAWRSMNWPEPKAGWYDTMHMSRALLKTGSLDIGLRSYYGFGKAESPLAFIDWDMMSNPMRMQLVNYCGQDAIPTGFLARDLSVKLTAPQLEGSRVDFIMNDRGIPIDLELARGQCIAQDAVTKDAVERAKLIDPVFTKKKLVSKFLLAWVKERGLEILVKTDKGAESLSGDLVQRIINGQEEEEDSEEYRWTWPEGTAVEVMAQQQENVINILKCRLAVNGIAASKAASAIENCGKDGRLHDYIGHAKAHPGRATGKGLQPQNLPRPKTSDVEALEAARLLVKELGRLDLGVENGD